MSRFRTTLIGLFLLSLSSYLLIWWRYPALVNGDAARLGIHAVDFLRHDVRSFYVYHQFAPHPLLIYLHAPVFTVFGTTVNTLKAITMLSGILVAPLAYVTLHEVLRGMSREFAWRAATVAGFSLAILPYYNTYSLLALEPMLMPVLELTIVAALFLGLRTQRYSAFALAGIVLGLSQYAYIVARFIPIALAVAVLADALFNWRRWLGAWKGILVTAFSAALVALPQWLLFLRYPYTFSARTEQDAGQFLWTFDDAMTLFWSKLWRQFTMLGWTWTNGYQPQSEQPLLSPILFVGIVLTLGLLIKYRKRSGLWFSVAFMVAMLVPDLIAVEGLNPSANRMTGAAVWVVIAAAFGVAWLMQLLPRYRNTLLLCVIGFGAWQQVTLHTKVIPAVHAMEGLEWKFSQVEIAQYNYIAAHPDERILLPTSEFKRIQMAYLLTNLSDERYGSVDLGSVGPSPDPFAVTVLTPVDPERPTADAQPAGYISNDNILVSKRSFDLLWRLNLLSSAYVSLSDGSDMPALLASNGVPTTHVQQRNLKLSALPYSELRPTEQQLFANGISVTTDANKSYLDLDQQLRAIINDPQASESALRLYQVPINATVTDPSITPLSRNETERLFETDQQAKAAAQKTYDTHFLTPADAGSTKSIVVVLAPERPIAADFELVLELFDPNQNKVWGSHQTPFNGSWQPRAWEPGVPVVFNLAVPIPDTLIAGEYSLIATLIDTLSREQIPTVDGAQTMRVARYKSPVVLTEAASISTDSIYQFDEGIFLLDAQPSLTEHVAVDLTFGIPLNLPTGIAPSQNYVAFLHLVDVTTGEIVAQIDREPHYGTYPTAIWGLGEVVPDTFVFEGVELQSDTAYEVYMGLYARETFARLPVHKLDASGLAGFDFGVDTAAPDQQRVPDDRILLFEIPADR